MATARPVVVQNQHRDGGVVGAGKPKGPAAEGNNNRRALGDIGNFVTVRGIDGKPQPNLNRPITRGFCQKLMANGQAGGLDGPENAKKQVAVAAAKGGVARAAQKKVTIKPKPEMIIEISPDTVEVKEKAKTHRVSNPGTSKKKVHTLSSVMTARSKAACGITNKPKETVTDIDGADVDDELSAVEYVEDLYKFYKLTEGSSLVHDYIGSQIQINENMRMILVDWLIEVHNKFELTPETLYLTIHIVDRFLSKELVQRKELQLVGISAMLIASKYEEIWAPEVNDFVCISDNAYSRERVLKMEKVILGSLEWNLTVPTPYVFLLRFVKAAVSDKEMESMVYYFAELGLMQYEMIKYCPSLFAASAVYAAQCTLNKSPLWNETLQLHTGFSESQLTDCAKLLVSYHAMAMDPEAKLRVVQKKYSSTQRNAVALFPPAKNFTA